MNYIEYMKRIWVVYGMERDLGYRRVQHTGRGSYIISLPKEWIRDLQLERGNQLAFKLQEDSSLLLVPRRILEEINI